MDTGFDLTASDSTRNASGQRYHARYLSVGRQIGRAVYVSGDYSTSLSVIQFSRTDGLVIEQRPRTRRISGSAVVNVGRGSAVVNVGRSVSLLATLERNVDDSSRELRALTGMTYRFR